MVTMAIIWDMLVWVTVVMDMAIIWAMLDMDMVIIWDITARGLPRLNQLLRLMLRLPQRLTPGCTITDLDMPLVLMDMVTMVIIWDTLPMLDITPTPTTEAAEITSEPTFPAPGNSVEVSAIVLLK